MWRSNTEIILINIFVSRSTKQMEESWLNEMAEQLSWSIIQRASITLISEQLFLFDKIAGRLTWRLI